MSFIRTSILALAIALSPPAWGAEMRPFDLLRQQLLARGFKPVLFKRPAPAACEYHPACFAYPEAQACAPTGRADCEMFYTKGATTIRVITRGDVIGRIAAIEQKQVARSEINQPHSLMDDD